MMIAHGIQSPSDDLQDKPGSIMGTGSLCILSAHTWDLEAWPASACRETPNPALAFCSGLEASLPATSRYELGSCIELPEVIQEGISSVMNTVLAVGKRRRVKSRGEYAQAGRFRLKAEPLQLRREGCV